MRRSKGFTLIELLVVIVIIGLLAALLLPAIVKALCNARQGAAEHLIDNLTQATKNYEIDNNKFPDGDGTESKKLADALTAEGPKKIPYFDFPAGTRTSGGDITNPVSTSVEVLRYRRNYPPGGTGNNKYSFDLWGIDCNGTNNGCNNWE